MNDPESRALLNPPPLEMYNEGGVRRVYEVIQDQNIVIPGDIVTHTTMLTDFEGNLIYRSIDYSIFLGILDNRDDLPDYIPYPGFEKQTLYINKNEYTKPEKRAISERREYQPGKNGIDEPHVGTFETHLILASEMTELCNAILAGNISKYSHIEKDISPLVHLENLSQTLLGAMNAVQQLHEANHNLFKTINQTLVETFQERITEAMKSLL